MNIYVQLEKNDNKHSSSPLILVGSYQELGLGAASCGVGATQGSGGRGACGASSRPPAAEVREKPEEERAWMPPVNTIPGLGHLRRFRGMRSKPTAWELLGKQIPNRQLLRMAPDSVSVGFSKLYGD